MATENFERWIEHDGPALVAELEVRRAIDLAMMDVDRLGDHLEDTIAFFDRACTGQSRRRMNAEIAL